MIVWYGQIGETGKWRAVRGDVVRECADAAVAYNTAVQLAGYKRNRVRTRVFPAPAAPPPKTPAKAPTTPESPADDRVAALLAQGTTAIKAALRSGDYDDIAAELLAAEEAGKNRGTAIKAICGRME
jgi:hypothetical protein